jgi:glycosyltransferase involved in cell wall biosynthesis
VLVTGLGYFFTDRRGDLISKVTEALYRLALKKVTTVIFQNIDDEMVLRDTGIIDGETRSLVVNGSGVDLREYSPEPLPANSPRFLMIARLLGNKGVREYVEAASRVKRRHPGVCFSLAGWIDEGPDSVSNAELTVWVQRGDIDYLGPLKDVRPAIINASTYVLPSYREGTPRTVLEAMAMGRPIITTDAPGCRETVIDGENGFLVPVKSVDALVDAMQKFIDDPELAIHMGKRSRMLAEQKYDVHKVNAIMLREMGIT